MVDLDLIDGTSKVTVRPERGGMATRFVVGDREVFFMDTATLEDPAKNVRGGNPVLFPSPGKLVDDRWARGTLKQHGFARNLPWAVVKHERDRLVLELQATPETRASYPWSFVARLTYSLAGTTLRIEQSVENHDASPMPVGFGFHPYFTVREADKGSTRIPTTATRAFDNVSKTEIALRQPIDLARGEVDLHLLDHDRTSAELVTPTGTIALRGSPEYTHWVVWTLPKRDFVCLEPWTCPGNALNTNERLLQIPPSGRADLWIEIEAAAQR